jgi:hypothetical protein
VALIDALPESPLLPPLVRTRLRAAAATLPPYTNVLLECHLRNHSPRVDFAAFTPTGGIEIDCATDIPSTPAIFRSVGVENDAAAIASQLSSIAPATRTLLERLQCSFVIAYVAAMPSRPGNPLRVNLSLREGDVTLLGVHAAALHAEYAPFVSHTVLAVDILDGTILPRLGLECYGGDALLPSLVAQNLCTETEAEALRVWPGRNTWPHDVPMPESHARLAALLGHATVWRTVNHYKIVDEPGAPRQAKAYLSAFFGER